MRLLAYTSPARGHLYPIVPILTTLAERGHSVSVCTLSGELEHLAAVGIKGSALDPEVESNQLEDWRERSPHRAAFSVLRTFAERAISDAPYLARTIEEHDPDVLLIDINCWGAATVAEASGRPWAMYSPYLLPLPSRDAPPFGSGLLPMRGPLGRARDAIVRRAVDAVFDRTGLPSVNKLRAQYCLPAIGRFNDLLGRPPLLLSLTAEGFEYPRRDWPANVRLVGSVNWDPSLALSDRQSLEPPWLAEMSDPLVLVTCSTERQRDKRLLHVALEALPAAGMSVLGTTAAHDPNEFNAPTGSRVVRFLSHEVVLRRAACVVCHGGMGITQKALAAEVPLVVVPFGRDQAYTARRVELARAGVRLLPRRLTPGRLRQVVLTAMKHRSSAQRESRVHMRTNGPLLAADTIEALTRAHLPEVRQHA
jgi:UDP:flavonoid glycosyltransferase YjiC (YdhE family)